MSSRNIATSTSSWSLSNLISVSTFGRRGQFRSLYYSSLCPTLSFSLCVFFWVCPIFLLLLACLSSVLLTQLPQLHSPGLFLSQHRPKTLHAVGRYVLNLTKSVLDGRTQESYTPASNGRSTLIWPHVTWSKFDWRIQAAVWWWVM